MTDAIQPPPPLSPPSEKVHFGLVIEIICASNDTERGKNGKLTLDRSLWRSQFVHTTQKKLASLPSGQSDQWIASDTVRST